VVLPPLRERGEDVVRLARHFLADEDPERRLELGAEALDALRAHAWPGNARELRNLVRRLVARGGRGPVDADAIRRALAADRGAAAALPSPAAGARADDVATGADGRTLREIERVAIERALEDCRGNKQATARRLGIAPATLYEKIKRYGL
jgi:DNA-binding NtrC family response regulator